MPRHININNKFKKIGGTGKLVAIVLAASVIGGAATRLVAASVPDSSGAIHGCYDNSTGALKVIDSSNSTCANGETGLNWTQNNGAPVLHDADGQALGYLVNLGLNTYDSYGPNGGTEVYNSSLNRIVPFTFSSTTNRTEAGLTVIPFFASGDCSGTPYITGNMGTTPVKTSVLHWTSGSDDVYGVIGDSVAPAIVPTGSVLATGVCIPDSEESPDAYAITPTELPFTTPIATPFKL